MCVHRVACRIQCFRWYKWKKKKYLNLTQNENTQRDKRYEQEYMKQGSTFLSQKQQLFLKSKYRRKKKQF